MDSPVKSSVIGNYFRRITTFDSRSLALFRIFLGLMTIVDLLDRASVFEAMYSQNGLIPIDIASDVYSRAFLSKSCFSLHMLSGNDYYQAALFVIAACCALCVIVGYKVRFFLIISWLLHLSVHARNPIYGSAADTTLVFWAIFLPLSQRASVDGLQSKHNLRLSTTALHIGGGCYLLQLFVMYVSAAYAKDYMWRDGGALMKVMEMDLLVNSFGRYLTSFPWLLSALTLVAWWTEALGTLLLLWPLKMAWTRGLCFLLFFGLHLGIATTCDIGLFPFFSLVFLLPLIPGAWWDWLRIGLSKQKEQSLLTATDTLMPHRSSGQKAFNIGCITAAVVSIVIIIFTTLPGVNQIGNAKGINSVTSRFLSITKFRQGWRVFAQPDKMNRDGWFVIEGTLPDGQKVDILRDNGPVLFSRPPLSGPRRLSIIWRTYLAGQERTGGANLNRLAAYLNRMQQRSGAPGFEFIRMIFMDEIGPENQDTNQLVFWSGAPPELE